MTKTTELIWPNGAPGAVGQEDVDKPALLVRLPQEKERTGVGVVVCPGGGYSHLATGHEGEDVAAWLNSHGIAAFILTYRLGPRYQHPAPLEDALRAMRTVRARSGEWGVDPKRIGIMGFSAGGHLASTVATHYTAGKLLAGDPVERHSSRPDFVILGYPVISLTMPYSHRGSMTNLLGPEPDPEMLAYLSSENQVTKDTPPTFLFHTTTDTGVSAMNSVVFYSALIEAGVPAEMHIFEQGKHGLGLAPDDPALSVWPDLCIAWLRTRGLLAK